ncbi:MAG: ABC transporter substrate binding protein, partial [Candidatus Rokuibacteriota bacterium]
MRAAATVTALIVAALAVGVLTDHGPARAQPAGKAFRVGFLTLNPARTENPSWDALLHKLRELGYVEGRNLVFEGRWAEGDPARLPGLAADLVRTGVDVIVAQSTAATGAAMRATTTIPIVFYSVGSPVERKIVGSLARPGGNVTGLSV